MSGPDYQHYFNYYNDNRVTDFTFDGYQATTNNPGAFLLSLTFLICISSFIIGVLVFPGSPLHPIYRKFLSLFLNIGDGGGSISSISDSSTQAGNGDYRDGDDEEEQKGAVGTNSKIGMDHDDSTIITTTSSTSNRYQDGGSLSKSKTSVDQIRGKPVREKPMVLITTRNGKVPSCSKKSRYTANTLEKTMTVAEKRKAFVRSRSKEHMKGTSNQQINIRPSSTASEGRLDFGNSAFYLTKMIYDEGRPSTDDGTKTDSVSWQGVE